MRGTGLGFASVETLNENLIHVVFQDLAEIDLDEAKQLKKEILKYSGGKKYILILNSGKARIDISHKAREFLVENEELIAQVQCHIYIAKSMANKLIFHFFKNYHKPAFPARIFDNIKEAQHFIQKELIRL